MRIKIPISKETFKENINIELLQAQLTASAAEHTPGLCVFYDEQGNINRGVLEVDQGANESALLSIIAQHEVAPDETEKALEAEKLGQETELRAVLPTLKARLLEFDARLAALEAK